MYCQIEEVKVLALGTRAVTLETACQGFLLENCSPSATVYFREKDADGVDCSSRNGFALAPGERTGVVLTARELSLVASAEGADVRILLLDMG